jgi:hypothetical protein
MSKSDLTFSENKTKADLTLESKDAGLIWSDATWPWSTADSSWAAPKITLTKESKTKADLTKEAK